ncbi:MAG: hypothetical protein V1793_15200 [Pseudomonadota bacterium]
MEHNTPEWGGKKWVRLFYSIDMTIDLSGLTISDCRFPHFLETYVMARII